MADAFQRIDLDIAFRSVPFPGGDMCIVGNRECIDDHTVTKVSSDSFRPIGHIADQTRMYYGFVVFTGKHPYRYTTVWKIGFVIGIHTPCTWSNGCHDFRTFECQYPGKNSSAGLTGRINPVFIDSRGTTFEIIYHRIEKRQMVFALPPVDISGIAG